MVRFSVLIFALVLVQSSADGWAQDKSGVFSTYGNETCGYYLDAYSRTTLINGGMKGPSEALGGFLDGLMAT